MLEILYTIQNLNSRVVKLAVVPMEFNRRGETIQFSVSSVTEHPLCSSQFQLFWQLVALYQF